MEGIGLGNKNSIRHYENRLKQLKTDSTNTPWAYIHEGLLSEGFLHLRYGALIFRRAFFCEGWGGGGAYYQNFMVLQTLLDYMAI